MSSICWAGHQEQSVGRESVRGLIAPRLVLAGLWTLNVLIVLFAFPVLVFINLWKFIHRRSPQHNLPLSKASHP